MGRVPRGATQYELMTAAIELLRNGDVAVTTNGVTWTIPRVLFANDDDDNGDGTTNDAWNFDRLVDIGHGTGGIECYFVRTLFYEDGSDGPVGANSSGGIVLTAAAHVTTLAHEIGHAFNLCDIYVATREKEKYVFGVNAKDVGNNPINYSCALDDWNGGCHGSGDSGARYYQDGTTMSILIPRLVMYGIVRENDVRRDITCGRVDGVWYSGEGAAKVWYDTDADIGFFSNPFRTESPCHD